ncbi:MAG: AAA family ATPase [Elusimicrobia bacterium]|nr:AAA family ATPase [Elusimicrobiota bacterium]
MTASRRMEKLVFFGKGGIGKSTISANLAAILAAEGRRMLVIGCDPKHDSTVMLTGDSSTATFKERHEAAHHTELTEAELLTKGKFGIDCVEAGGPDPGLGCAGYGITQLLETLGRLDLMKPERYDAVVFDILGDVVCGGFAAPLRQGFAEKIFIIVSEEMAALYAANNIAKAVRTYSSNGAVLGGLIVNMRDPEVDREMLERFARLLNTRILGFIPRDPGVRQAEYLRKTMLEHAPDSDIVAQFKSLAAQVLAVDTAATPVPTPIPENIFTDLSLRQFRDPPPGARLAPAPAAVKAAPAKAQPDGARLGGQRSLADFSKLLQLGDRWSLESAFLQADGCVGLGVKEPDRPGVVVLLRPPDREGGFLRTPNFGVCFQGSGAVTPAMEDVIRRTAARLGPVPLKTLQRLIERDPEAVGTLPSPAGGGPAREKRTGLPAPYDPGPRSGAPALLTDLSLQFFFDECSAVGGMPQGSLFVHHGDWECWFVFINGPFGFWERNVVEGSTRGDGELAVIGRSTDVGLDDVLEGGAKKLEAAVEGYLRENPKPDLLVIRTYCLPMIMGDDVEGVLEKLRRKHGFAIATATGLNPEEIILKSCVAQAFASPRFRNASPDQNKVNLIGFASGLPREELAGLIGTMGLEVAQSLIPGWTYSGLERLRDAGLQVLSPRQDCAEVFSAFAAEGTMRFVSPAPPYGLLGTRSWLKAIDAAAGGAPRFEKTLGPRFRALHRTWKTLRARAAKHRLGFVITEADLPSLEGARSLGGLPLLPMVREMGFGVDLLLWTPPGAAPAGPEAFAPGTTVHRFTTPERLEELLSGLPLSAVYSDIHHDRRLLRNGKSRFSRFSFEPGFDGALRTLRRLLRICELPLHRRYESLWRKHGLQ